MRALPGICAGGFRTQTDLRRLSFDQRFGEAVASLRTECALRRSDIQRVSTREVARIESGGAFPRLETVGRLASAHGVDVAGYLGAVAEILSHSDRGERGRRRQGSQGGRRIGDLCSSYQEPIDSEQPWRP